MPPLTTLTRWCLSHRRLVIGLWLVALLAGAATAPLLFGRLSSTVGHVPGSESDRAATLVGRIAPTGDQIVGILDGRDADSPALRADVATAERRISVLPGVARVTTPNSPGGAAAISTDRRAVAVVVDFVPHRPQAGEVHAAAAVLRAVPGVRATVSGGPLLDDEMSGQASQDLKKAELLSTPVVVVLLVLVFGGVIAAGLPLALAAVAVCCTFLALTALSLVVDISVYSVNVVTMLGLGLAVDYGLLLVTRFREERAGADAPLAVVVERVMATAGRSVLYSGLTVSVALGALVLFPDDFLRSMGLAGLSVVLLDLLAAMTLLPVLLAAAGHRIRPSRHRTDEGRALRRLARGVRRRPVAVLLVIGTVLVLPALPLASARFADPDARSLPASTDAHHLSDLAATRFPRTVEPDPLVVAGDRTTAPAALADYRSRLAALPGVARVTVRPGLSRGIVLDVVPAGLGQSEAARRLVRAVRATPAPEPVLVGGSAARLDDYVDALLGRAPLALAVLLSAVFLLLFAFTGSVLVPLKAVLTTVLSLGAGLGALVVVFQDGHLGSLFGTSALGTLSITTPVLVFAIGFGLSMDYEVFLLGRIAEEYRRTGDNDAAVDRGLAATGRVITTAALLIVTVFAGFVAGGFSPIKQVGLGLVLAVALDATLVRMLLVPAVMTLLGDRNWWAPRFLAQARLRVVEGHLEAAAPVPGPRPCPVAPAGTPVP